MRYLSPRNRRTFILLVVLALSFAIISSHLSGSAAPAGNGFADRLIVRLISPFQRGISAILSTVKIVWYNYTYLVKLKEKNEMMADRISRLENEMARLREKAGATDRLAELLQFKANNPFDLKVARIIGFDSGGYNRAITLDKGSANGVGLNMAVVNARGVVGRVVKTFPTTCQVLMLVDYNSAIDAVIQRTRDKGIVVGRGGTTCELKYVDRQSDVQLGDVVVTSGLTGIFPAGLILGEVSAVQKEGTGLFQSITVRPAVQVDRIEEVLIVLKERA